MKLQITITVEGGGNFWTAISNDPKLSANGRTYTEAVRNIGDALAAWAQKEQE